MSDATIAADLRNNAAVLLIGSPTEKAVGLDLLAQADVLDPPSAPKLTYLGYVKLDKVVPQYSTGGFTQRPNGNGVVVGHIGAAQALYECTLPTPSATSPVTQALPVKTYPGALFAGRTWPVPWPAGFTQDQILGHLPIRGVYATSSDQLVVLYSNNYNVNDGPGYPVFILVSNLDAPSPVVTGPYSAANVGNNRASGYATELPDYLAALVGGRKLAVGAGIVSGSASCSFGPDLWAIFSPGPTAGSLGSGIALQDYPQAERCYRTPDYVPLGGVKNPDGSQQTAVVNGVTYHVYAPLTSSDGQFELPANGNGYWPTTDSVGGATWCGNGVLYCGSKTTSYVWYGDGTVAIADGSGGYVLVKSCSPTGKGQGGVQTGYVMSFWYTPAANLLAVATGKSQPADIIPQWSAPAQTASAPIIGDCQRDLSGLYFNPTTKLLYAGAPRCDNGYPMVHVWRVV